MSEKTLLQDEELEQVSGGVNTSSFVEVDYVNAAGRCTLSPTLRHQWENLPGKPGCKVCHWCKLTQTAQG